MTQQTMTAAEWREMHGLTVPGTNPGTSPAPVAARLRRPDPLLGYATEGMNKLEKDYAERLESMRRSGEIAAWGYETMTLHLAGHTSYKPDFFILLPNGAAGFHETKGRWRDDARVKIKVAARLFPWFFFAAVQWDNRKKLWKFESFRDTGEASCKLCRN